MSASNGTSVSPFENLDGHQLQPAPILSETSLARQEAAGFCNGLGIGTTSQGYDRERDLERPTINFAPSRQTAEYLGQQRNGYRLIAHLPASSVNLRHPLDHLDNSQLSDQQKIGLNPLHNINYTWPNNQGIEPPFSGLTTYVPVSWNRPADQFYHTSATIQEYQLTTQHVPDLARYQVIDNGAGYECGISQLVTPGGIDTSGFHSTGSQINSSNLFSGLRNPAQHHPQLADFLITMHENLQTSDRQPDYHQSTSQYQVGIRQATAPSLSRQGQNHFTLLEPHIRERIYKYVFQGPYDTVNQHGDPTTPQTPALVAALRGDQELYQEAVEFYFGHYKWVFNAYTCDAIMKLGSSAKRLIKQLKISRTWFLHNGIPGSLYELNRFDPSEFLYMRYTQIPVALFAQFPSLTNLTLHFPLCEFHELAFITAALQACPKLDRFAFQRPAKIKFHPAFDRYLSSIIGIMPFLWTEAWRYANGRQEDWHIYAWFAGAGGWHFGENGKEKLKHLGDTNKLMS